MSHELTGKDHYVLGIVSDTHGSVPGRLAKAFKGVDLIVHAGDIGKPTVIPELQTIAPVAAVRGNVDYDIWAFDYWDREIIQVGPVKIGVLHNLEDLETDWDKKYQCIIYGHTHKQAQEERKGVLFVNPGVAGAHSHHQTAALLHVQGESLCVEFVNV